MAKKVAPSINTPGASCYAILVPNFGFLKEVYGKIEFEEKLPKASGCFKTEQEAKDGMTRALNKAINQLADTVNFLHRVRDSSSLKWKIDRDTETVNYMKNAVVVKISVTQP